MRSSLFVVPALLSAAVLAACATAQQPAHAGDKPQFTAQQVKSASANAAQMHTDNGLTSAPSDQVAAALDAALRELAAVKVFFAYDQSTLTAQAENKLSVVADILSKNPSLEIQVQGNCDERGTEAYNLALGQRRADSAVAYLIKLGARANQLKTLSLGDDHPQAAAHDEAAYQQNRRDDVIAK